MHRLIVPLINTVLWSWWVKWSLDTAIVSVMLFPWLLLTLYWPLALMSAVLWFWACCYAGVCRMDKRPKRWLEIIVLVPWILLVLPLFLHVAAFLLLLDSWRKALRPDQQQQPEESALVPDEG